VAGESVVEEFKRLLDEAEAAEADDGALTGSWTGSVPGDRRVEEGNVGRIMSNI